MEKEALRLFLPFLFFAFLFALALGYFLYSDVVHSPSFKEAPKISIWLAGSAPFVEGERISAIVLSTCGDFEVFHDGKALAQVRGGERHEMPIALERGNHTISALNERCRASLSYEVKGRECEEGAKEACQINGCAGTRICIKGEYTKCAEAKKICIPGERIGCIADGCSFGYAVCNPCGTGFGECLIEK